MTGADCRCNAFAARACARACMPSHERLLVVRRVVDELPCRSDPLAAEFERDVGGVVVVPAAVAVARAGDVVEGPVADLRAQRAALHVVEVPVDAEVDAAAPVL